MAIETAGVISTEVLAIVDDGSYTSTDVISYINKALNEISGRFLLPELEAEDTVDTTVDQNYSALPSNFQRNLHYCYSEDNNREVKVYKSFRLILRSVGVIDQAGYVVGVAVRGGNLHYQRIPSAAETLQIHYYKNPTVISGVDGSPSCIPQQLGRALLVNYCCKEIFSLIEEDTDGKKPNTDKYEGKYRVALAELSMFIGDEASLPVEFDQVVDWDFLSEDC